MSPKPTDILRLMGRGNKITKPSHSLPKAAAAHTAVASKILVTGAMGTTPSGSQGWILHGSHLIQYVPRTSTLFTSFPLKVAAFDLDDTLVRTKSGGKFATHGEDWQYLTDKVLLKIHELWALGYTIVVFTNQGGVVPEASLKSYLKLKARVSSITASLYDGVTGDAAYMVFGSPKYPKAKSYRGVKSTEAQHAAMRKPEPGMWQALVKAAAARAKVLGLVVSEENLIDMPNSFFVGDAAGRPGDFSDSDKRFAEKVGLTFYTPEAFFQ